MYVGVGGGLGKRRERERAGVTLDVYVGGGLDR